MDALAIQILTFIEPVAMISLLVFFYGLTKRSIPTFASRNGSVTFDMAVGTIFVLCVIYSMIDPITLSSGIVFDMRCLFVGTATGLFGPVVGLVPLLMGSAFRSALGGVGVGPGITAMVMSFAGAWFWRHYIREKFDSSAARGVTLGLAISIHIPAILMLPRGVWMENIGTLVPYYLTTNTLGAIVIKALLRREDRLLIETVDLRIAAHRDPLTGVRNRRRMESLHAAHVEPLDEETGFAMLCLDIDDFKSINDRYGHAVGDAALKFVAAKVLTELRSHDLIGRIGGDEFLIMLPRVDPETSIAIAERCRKAVDAGALRTEDGDVSVTISIGCSWQMRPTTFEEDVKAADRELYRAKNSGKNCVSAVQQMNAGGPTALRPVTAS